MAHALNAIIGHLPALTDLQVRHPGAVLVRPRRREQSSHVHVKAATKKRIQRICTECA